jgi:hypothetical protein
MLARLLLISSACLVAARKKEPPVEAPAGWDPVLAVYCATALLVLSLLLKMTMSFVFNGPSMKAKTNEQYKKMRADPAVGDPTYWRMSRTQLNTEEYVPTMALLMFYLFSVYKASIMPSFAAYSCLVATISTYAFAIGYATQKGTVWGNSLEPPFAPPPLRALATVGRYAGLGMLIYSAYFASM